MAVPRVCRPQAEGARLADHRAVGRNALRRGVSQVGAPSVGLSGVGTEGQILDGRLQLAARGQHPREVVKRGLRIRAAQAFAEGGQHIVKLLVINVHHLFLYRFGSHGCVNLPVDKATALYDLIATGDVVVCHW